MGRRGDFIRQPWSTPVAGYRETAGRRVATRGEGRWHPGPPDGEFAYLEFRLDDISYEPAGLDGRLGAHLSTLTGSRMARRGLTAATVEHV
jgi:hypothetical protein